MALENKKLSRLIPYQPNLPMVVNNLVGRIDKWNQYSKKDLAVMSQFTTGSDPEELRQIPDNCIEFVFVINDSPKAYIKGPFSKMDAIRLEPNSTYFLFKPTSISGTVFAKYGLKELESQRIPFEMFFKEIYIIENMTKASDFEERVSIFKNYAKENVLDSVHQHPLSEHIQRIICDERGSEQIKHLASKIGFSSRYCLNKFRDSLGLTIKSYSSIIRFQNIVRGLVSNRPIDFQDIIIENNLYDQAHLIHIFQRYTGLSPKEYLRTISRPN